MKTWTLPLLATAWIASVSAQAGTVISDHSLVSDLEEGDTLIIRRSIEGGRDIRARIETDGNHLANCQIPALPRGGIPEDSYRITRITSTTQHLRTPSDEPGNRSSIHSELKDTTLQLRSLQGVAFRITCTSVNVVGGELEAARSIYPRVSLVRRMFHQRPEENPYFIRNP